MSLESEAGVGVGCEDLLDGVGVRSRSQVQAEVELLSSLHDGLRGKNTVSLHRLHITARHHVTEVYG